MKQTRFLSTVSFLMLVLFFCSPPEIAVASGLSVSELKLSGVTLMQSSEQIGRRLGHAVASHRTLDDATGEPAVLRVFPQLTAYFIDGQAMRVKTSDPGLTTPAGAKVGDSIERILSLYPQSVPRIQTPTRLELSIDGTEARLVFHLHRQRVTAIELMLSYA